MPGNSAATSSAGGGVVRDTVASVVPRARRAPAQDPRRVRPLKIRATFRKLLPVARPTTATFGKLRGSWGAAPGAGRGAVGGAGADLGARRGAPGRRGAARGAAGGFSAGRI